MNTRQCRWVWLIASCAVTLGQTKPEFEVASIRAADPNESFIQAQTPSLRADASRNLVFKQASIANLIMLAYNVGAPQIIGPDWLSVKLLANADHFDVRAIVPEGSTPEQVPLMLQSLLAERFHLTFHQETRTIGAYELVVGKNGHKLKTSPEEGGGKGICSRDRAQKAGVSLAAECKGIVGGDIAAQIQTLAPGYFREGPIMDKTNLTGHYDFSLEWITVEESRSGVDGPSMFDAVEKQLGLKIESRKQALPVLVIDKIDRMPTEN